MIIQYYRGHLIYREISIDTNGNNLLEKMISVMYEMSNKGIVFNFLTDRADFYNPEMYYESIEEITDFCTNNLSRHLIIDHGYPLTSSPVQF